MVDTLVRINSILRINAVPSGCGLPVLFLLASKYVLCCLLLLPLLTVQASDDVFGQLIEMRQAANLFHQKRYKDSVEAFEPIYKDLQAQEPRNLKNISNVLNFLAQGKSFLGLHGETLELMKERLSIADQMFGEQSEEYSSVMAALAEARYRDGDTAGARKTILVAIEGLEANAAKDSDYLQLARINLEKYENGPFDNSDLPVDLSEFYSRCESIIPGENENSVSMKMGSFVELGIDYEPEDFWAAMFEIAAKGPDGTAREGNNYRRIFIPGTEEALRVEVCVVDQRSGIVINAENSLE